MSQTGTRKHSGGFALVEVLIATVILSVGFLGLSAMTTAAIRSLALSNHRTTATTLVQDKLEEMKNDTYANVTSAKYNTEAYNTLAGYPQYSRTVTITAGPAPHTRLVTVTVSRRDSGVFSHDVTLSTIISQ